MTTKKPIPGLASVLSLLSGSHLLGFQNGAVVRVPASLVTQQAIPGAAADDATNDTTPIQAALDATRALTLTSAKDYRVSGLNALNKSIFGAMSKLSPTGNSQTLLGIAGSSGWANNDAAINVIRDLILDGADRDGITGIDAQNALDLVLENLTMRRMSRGLRLTGAIYAKLQGLSIWGSFSSTGSGLLIENNPTFGGAILVEGERIDIVDTGAQGAGIVVKNRATDRNLAFGSSGCDFSVQNTGGPAFIFDGGEIDSSWHADHVYVENCAIATTWPRTHDGITVPSRCFGYIRNFEVSIGELSGIPALAQDTGYGIIVDDGGRLTVGDWLAASTGSTSVIPVRCTGTGSCEVTGKVNLYGKNWEKVKFDKATPDDIHQSGGFSAWNCPARAIEDRALKNTFADLGGNPWQPSGTMLNAGGHTPTQDTAFASGTRFGTVTAIQFASGAAGSFSPQDNLAAFTIYSGSGVTDECYLVRVILWCVSGTHEVELLMPYEGSGPTVKATLTQEPQSVILASKFAATSAGSGLLEIRPTGTGGPKVCITALVAGRSLIPADLAPHLRGHVTPRA